MQVNEYGLTIPKNTELLDVSFLLDNITSSLFLKMENYQITKSHKYRLAFGLLTGYLTLNGLANCNGFVESSSGNTALALAELTNTIHKPITVIVTENISPKIKHKLLKYSNVTIMYADDSNDAFDLAEGLFYTNNLVHLNQYDNVDGVVGFRTMGIEILNVNPNINTIVMGIGTGATITGLSQVIPNVTTIACTIEDTFGTIEGWKNLHNTKPGAVLLEANERGYVNIWKRLYIDQIIDAKKGLMSKLSFVPNLSTVGNLLAAIQHGNAHNDQNIVTVCTGVLGTAK